MKKKMFFAKSVALVMAMLLCVLAFSGCGNKANDKDEQGRTVISIGGWPDKEGKALDNKNAAKAEFEAQNPDVVVNGDPWKFEVKTFYAKAAGGQLPTLYDTYYTEIPQIMDSEYSADLTNALKKRGYDGMFNPQVLDVVSKDGKVYAFPYDAYVLGIGFNTELLKAAGLMEADGTPKQPKTWAELAEFAVQIKEKTGKPGFVFPTSENTGGWLFTCLAWSFGTDFMEKNADGKWQATFNTPEAAAALQYIKDLKWKYDVLPTNTLISFSEYYKTFATGGAGMFITEPTMPFRVVQYDMKPEQVGMMALPAGPKRHVTLLGGGLYCINDKATDDQIDATLRWIERSFNFNATEIFKASKEKEVKENLEKGVLVGIKGMSVWSNESESVIFQRDLIDKNANANPNHVKLYNDFIMNCPAEIQAEEPVCAQELYGVLDSCIQEVLINKDADCAAVLEKANADFQVNYLDNLTY